MSNKVRLVGLFLVVVVALAGFAPAAFAKTETSTPAPTIVGVALDINAKTGEFSTLISALKYLGLVGTFNNPNAKFTVFAPTDAAFAVLGLNAKNISALPKSTLREILFYHVSKGQRFSGSVFSKPSILMLNGDRAKLSLTNGPMIDNAKIVMANVKASNGFIHVIDKVILPK